MQAAYAVAGAGRVIVKEGGLPRWFAAVEKGGCCVQLF